MELITPLGTIQVLLDGSPIPFSTTQLAPIKNSCPDIAARYKIEGKLVRDNDEYDYDGKFIEKDGVFYNSYAILQFTKTTHYVFGISWIFDCTSTERDTQTWFGANPTLM